ncbi:hypothetical protein V6N12_074929 [Hibiscus sabdariffa]|uniref:Uncharacterized protein n=1 Tax=Hibiscus sabdariffa TaxID=183260 RepID=A0ABR2AVY5_9ROSI
MSNGDRLEGFCAPRSPMYGGSLDLMPRYRTSTKNAKNMVVLGPRCDGEHVSGDGAHYRLTVTEIETTNSVGSKC